MNKRPIILLGGGGHCMSVIEAAESAGMSILGILDIPATLGMEVMGHKIIGCDDDIQRYADEADFVVTVGSIKNASVRRRLYEKVKACGGRLACVVASTARVSTHATMGEGTVVLHHALVNAGAQIGKNCIINSFADIEHGCSVGNHTHVSTHAAVNGDCSIGHEVFIGSGSVLHQGCQIADKCVVAAGSVVRKHITTGGLYAGNPAIFKHSL